MLYLFVGKVLETLTNSEFFKHLNAQSLLSYKIMYFLSSWSTADVLKVIKKYVHEDWDTNAENRSVASDISNSFNKF